MDKAKNSIAVIVAAICAVVFITLVTVIADLEPLVKDWLKAVFNHHWIGKSVLASILFLLVYQLVYWKGFRTDEGRIAVYLRLLTQASLVGTFLIFAFFVYEAYLK